MDGSLLTVSTTSDTTASATSTTDVLEVAADFSGNYADWTQGGEMKYLQIFNRQLSQTEMEIALLSPGSITNGLIGYWKIDGQLTSEPDLSTTGADFTVNGTPASGSSNLKGIIPQQMMIT